MRIAILGPNGQIGHTLVKWLLARKVGEVISIVRNQAAKQSLDDCGSEIRVGAITDAATCKRLLDDCEVVVNCAWPGGLPKSAWSQNEAIVKNVLAAKNLKQFITLSSVAVYGALLDGRKTSFTHPVPNDSYGRIKLKLEEFTEETKKSTTAEVLILRLGHVYGPNQWASHFIADTLEDRISKLPFDGIKPSNAIHIAEVCAAIENAILIPTGSRTLNLASLPQRSWREVFDWHSATLGFSPILGLDAVRSNKSLIALLDATHGGVGSEFGRSIRGVASSLAKVALSDSRVKESFLFLLSHLPEVIGAGAKMRYSVKRAQGDIMAANARQIIPPLFLYNAMPGEYLEYKMPDSQNVFLQESAKEHLREWFAQTRAPGVILHDQATFPPVFCGVP